MTGYAEDPGGEGRGRISSPGEEQLTVGELPTVKEHIIYLYTAYVHDIYTY
jgi:hypothetical protein